MIHANRLLVQSLVVVSMTMASSRAQADNWPTVTLPTFPAITSVNTFDITNYGASTTAADNTAAIQKALDAAKNAGGGKVVIPQGTFLSGPVKMGSNTILSISKGAVLQALSYGTYPAKTGTTGASGAGYDNLIGCVDNAKNLRVTGGGTIYGNGVAWWKAIEAGVDMSRGCMIRFQKGNYIQVDSITVKDAPGVNITIGQNGNSSDATIYDVTISEPSSHDATQKSHNTDGISTWCPRVNIHDCHISNGDDNVVADAGSKYIHVWNCDFGEGHGASVGSFTTNVKHVLFEGITFKGTDNGLRVKSQAGRGGGEEDIVMQNCTMTGVANPIYLDEWYDKSTKPDPKTLAASDSTSTTPAFHDIYVKNVTATGIPYNSSAKAGFAIFAYGRPESYIRNVTFDNVQIESPKGMLLNFCQVNFINGSNIKITRTGMNQIYSQYQATVMGTYNGTSAVISNTYHKDVKSVVYFDLQGRQLQSANGLSIRDILFADGSHQAEKVLVR